MKVTVVRPHELGATEVTAWLSMQRSSETLDSPFLTPGFTLAAGRSRPAARVAVLEDGQELSGFFAFERTRWGAGHPIAGGVCDRQAIVHAEGFAPDARELLRGCGLSSWEFHHLVGPQFGLTTNRVTARRAPVIELSDGFADYLEQVRRHSKIFKTTRNLLRRLEREVGPVRLELDARAPEEMEQLLSWKSAQYRRTGRLDRVAVGWVRSLLWDLFEHRGDGCCGTLSALYAGEHPVAAHFGLRGDSCLAYWFPAYDPDFARLSPGIGLLLRMTEALASGPYVIDLGKGDEHYKLAVATGARTVGEGWIYRASPAAALHGLRRGPQQLAYHVIMNNPPLHRVARGMLRRLGRLRTRRERPATG